MPASMDKETDEAIGQLRDMYAAHTLFRREFGLAPGLVRDVADDDAHRVRLICEHLDLILTLLELYRRGREDSPRLRGAADHVTALVGRWRESAACLHAKQLAAAVEELALLLNDYLARQEEILLWPYTASLAS
jgi:hypothetical protein